MLCFANFRAVSIETAGSFEMAKKWLGSLSHGVI
jgi:hypothetical protein